MKKFSVFILFFMISIVIAGQGKPIWLDDDFREMSYPAKDYFTGFAYGEVSTSRPLQDVIQQMITDAQADLSRKIRVQISSRSQTQIEAVSDNGQYSEKEKFLNRSVIESNAEVAGIQTETFHDAKARIVYAFAYVKRHQLTDYYKSNLAMNIVQTEGLLQTAYDLLEAGEKAKARGQCEAAIPLLAKLRTVQDLLTAIDVNVIPDDLQLTKTEALHNRLTQMLAQLAQAIFVYVECTESNFSKPTTVVGNRVKSTLSAKGCSFTDDPTQADFLLQIEATTRHHGDDRGFTTCYADVAIQLMDTRKGKNVFRDEFSQKGVTTSLESAGRKALEDAAPSIIQKISPWIEN